MLRMLKKPSSDEETIPFMVSGESVGSRPSIDSSNSRTSESSTNL